MAETSASVDLSVPPDRVWALVGGFGSLPDWLPFIPSSELDEGGRVRRLTTEHGSPIVERLERFDERAREYSYSIVRSPFPVTDYLATIAVREVPGGSRVEWSGVFTPAGAAEEEAVALFQGIFRAGLAAVEHTLTE